MEWNSQVVRSEKNIGMTYEWYEKSSHERGIWFHIFLFHKYCGLKLEHRIRQVARLSLDSIVDCILIQPSLSDHTKNRTTPTKTPMVIEIHFVKTQIWCNQHTMRLKRVWAFVDYCGPCVSNKYAPI